VQRNHQPAIRLEVESGAEYFEHLLDPLPRGLPLASFALRRIAEILPFASAYSRSHGQLHPRHAIVRRR
jgi:hypothetical protein